MSLVARRRSTLRDAFRNQRRRAAERGIEWRFTFDEWLRLWVDSGHLGQRGRGRGCYVMARRGDSGPYAAGNVSIQLYEENARDCRLNHPSQNREIGRRRLGTGCGWTFVKGRYQVVVDKRYVGRYATPEQATAVYQAACAAVRDA